MDAPLAQIQTLASRRDVRITDHARDEMDAESITLADVFDAIATGQILENYPDHRRGACCLLCGSTGHGRALHIVCTTARPLLIIVTVYEPLPPKWITPTERRQT